ncbi:MAG TPA: zinc ribbon domain-containing protein [Pyrinomonadaceae bacterium]|jgi:putative FmdB family regulatory protein|nr:zinc ribbon domain-containing protein [Pyrinomonadaceae bacterium]
MPIYEYSCKKCGAHLEVMQKISDPPPARHAKCGGKLEKEWSRTGFQFKGSGWYVTDYAGKKSEEPKEPKESKESKESESKETKSEPTETKATESKESKSKGPKSKKDAAATGGD